MPRRSADATGVNVDKSVEKPKKASNLVPFKPGPDPRRGKGPAKGAPNAGRPPDAWRKKMEELRDRWLIAAEANGAVDDTSRSDWLPLGKFLHEATAGKPAQAVDVTSNGETVPSQVIVIGNRRVEF